MASKEVIIALDEGTTNAKAVALDACGKVLVSRSRALSINTPREGWVEQPAELLVSASLAVIAEVIETVGADNVAALAISNQRETAVGRHYLAVFTHRRVLPVSPATGKRGADQSCNRSPDRAAFLCLQNALAAGVRA